jgi:hypothetical protein
VIVEIVGRPARAGIVNPVNAIERNSNVILLTWRVHDFEHEHGRKWPYLVVWTDGEKTW